MVYDVFTLKDGLVQRHALFNERQPALEAAGLGAGAIAHDNVEIVRLMNAAFNRGDLDEAFASYAPTAVWHSRRDEPDTGVVTSGWLCGRGRESGAEVRERYAWVIRLRDGKLAEVWEYRNRAEALEAVGLSE